MKREREEKDRIYGDLRVEREEGRALKGRINELEKRVLDKDVEIMDRELEGGDGKCLVSDEVAGRMKGEVEEKIRHVEELMKRSEGSLLEVKGLKERLGEAEYKNRYLEEALGEKGVKYEKILGRAREQKDLIEKIKEDRKEILYQKRKQEIMNKDKSACLKKALESIEIYKKTLKRLKKENNDLSTASNGKSKQIAKLNEEIKHYKEEDLEKDKKYKKMLSEYSGFKAQLAEKDTWILKLGKETGDLKNSIQNNRKKHEDYKNCVEFDYERNLDQKDTEIMVLKEMVKSAKAMVRAREMDITRLKNKTRKLESSVQNLCLEQDSNNYYSIPGPSSNHHYRIKSGKRDDDSRLDSVRRDYIQKNVQDQIYLQSNPESTPSRQKYSFIKAKPKKLPTDTNRSYRENSPLYHTPTPPNPTKLSGDYPNSFKANNNHTSAPYGLGKKNLPIESGD